MRFDQLASSTPTAVRTRSSKVQVHPEGVEEVEAISQSAFTFRTWSTSRSYVSWVCVDEADDVVVSCSCPYFLYNLEVALESRGASVIFYSNGAHPAVRNPEMRAYLCKHLYRLWQLKGVYGIKYRPPEEEEEYEVEVQPEVIEEMEEVPGKAPVEEPEPEEEVAPEEETPAPEGEGPEEEAVQEEEPAPEEPTITPEEEEEK